MESMVGEQRIFKHDRVVYRPKKPVLIVDPSPEQREKLAAVCMDLGIGIEVASTGGKALQSIEKQDFALFIVDIHLGDMEGMEFIRHIKRIHPDSLILIESEEENPRQIIEYMKLGVLDYVLKPFRKRLFEPVLISALEHRHLKDMENQIVTHSANQLRSQLEWLTYKDSRRNLGQDSQGRTAIDNLRESLSQGGGFGTVISLVEMMRTYAVMNGESYCVDRSLVDMIFENAEIARRNLEGLENFVELLDKPVPLEIVEGRDLVASIPQSVQEVVPYLRGKNVRIAYPEFHRDAKVHVNREMLGLVLEELVLNAYKYAKADTVVEVFANITEGYLCLSVKNEIQEKPYGGIPREMEKLVLEPFFRIHPPVEEVIHVEKYGIGLGLTVVNYLISKHNGLFFIGDVQDHTGTKIALCVLAQVYLPLLSEV